MPRSGPYCFHNSTDVSVNALHVIFTGTGGALRQGLITVGPAGRVRVNDNQVSVLLDTPLRPSSTLCLTVWSEVETTAVYMAFWSSDFNIVGPVDPMPVADEPTMKAGT
jgi:hypothetical protein